MAVPGDGALILSFIRALAEYEHMLDQVVATQELLEGTLCFKRPEKEDSLEQSL